MEKKIKCPMKVEEIFPYGKVLVQDIEKLKEKIKKIRKKRSNTGVSRTKRSKTKRYSLNYPKIYSANTVKKDCHILTK